MYSGSLELRMFSYFLAEIAYLWLGRFCWEPVWSSIEPWHALNEMLLIKYEKDGLPRADKPSPLFGDSMESVGTLTQEEGKLTLSFFSPSIVSLARYMLGAFLSILFTITDWRRKKRKIKLIFFINVFTCRFVHRKNSLWCLHHFKSVEDENFTFEYLCSKWKQNTVYSFEFAQSYFCPTEIWNWFAQSWIRIFPKSVSQSFIYKSMSTVLNSPSGQRAKFSLYTVMLKIQ